MVDGGVISVTESKDEISSHDVWLRREALGLRPGQRGEKEDI
jgi:hypothetical protein